MDYLMQFSNFSAMNAIESFVDSQDDLKKLVMRVNPVVIDYFNSIELSSKACKTIN